MTIYPAIDIKAGRAVRLERGQMERATDYGDPCAAAKRWCDEGAEYIHVVDLDGAIEGTGANLTVVRQIVRTSTVPVQMGGGIRTLEDIEIRLDEVGVARVILGTVAVSDPPLVKEAARRWPGRIVLGMDVREGAIAIRGWQESSEEPLEAFIIKARDAGIDTMIFTDIMRDGTMDGANLEEIERILSISGMDIIASGGISSLDDLRSLKKMGCSGAIVGRALYNGTLELKDALKV